MESSDDESSSYASAAEQQHAGDDGEAMDVDDERRRPRAEDDGRGSSSSSPSTSSHHRQRLDCYPYTFTPLLLFAPSGYFDRGYSNYNAVARFFDPVLLPCGRATRGGNGGTGVGEAPNAATESADGGGGRTRASATAAGASNGAAAGGNGGGDGTDDYGTDMLYNVVYERTNLTYEDLLTSIFTRQSLVTCCIDAHFTAFQCLLSNADSKKKKPKPAVLYYDPQRSAPSLVQGDGARSLALYLCMKCNYGDGQHVQDNKDHYVGSGTNTTRRLIYSLWKRIHALDGPEGLHDVRWESATLNLDKWVLINDRRNHRVMSVQLTGNTCYFQAYLFAVLCKVGKPSYNGRSIDLPGADELERCTAAMCRYLLEFFVQQRREQTTASTKGGATRGGAGAGGGDDGDGDGDVGLTVLRALTNSNFVLDFPLYASSPYHNLLTRYLAEKFARLGSSLLGSRAMSNNNAGKSRAPPGPPPPSEYGAQYGIVMEYYRRTRRLHGYGKFTLGGEMSTSPNAKNLQLVRGTDDGVRKLAGSDYYKYRAANFMFGFNAGIMAGVRSFSEFNSLRKNQLLRFYDGEVGKAVAGIVDALNEAAKGGGRKAVGANQYRDYYFMPQFELGQRELVDLHHYTFLIDAHAASSSSDGTDPDLVDRVHRANKALVEHIYFSTQKRGNYDKFTDIKKAKKFLRFFLNTFLTTEYLSDFIGLGFAEINPKEKEINSLTQTVFYATDLMRTQANRQEYEFEKECINQMARSNLRKYLPRYEGERDDNQKYKVSIRIGHGYTYSKYNTLMHFLNVAERYWSNPDLGNVQIFGVDIRALLAVSCQKVFFRPDGSGFYHYGPFEVASSSYYSSSVELDLAVASSVGHAGPLVSRVKRSGPNQLIVCDRVYEHSYLQSILQRLFASANGVRFKSDNEVINLALLSLMLDFGLYEQHVGLLNLPFLHDLQHDADTRELQVEVANLIYEFDRNERGGADYVTRSRVEELLFEVSYKFLINKNFNVHGPQFKLIRALNADPDYQSYVLLVKIYMSLCQINKSVEVDYYKVTVDDDYRIIIPANFSKSTSDYLDEITERYTWGERDGIMIHDDLPVFDLRPHQPEIHLYRVRFDSATEVQSMVKYVEISNVFRVLDERREQYLVFIADNVLMVDVSSSSSPSSSSGGGIITINGGKGSKVNGVQQKKKMTMRINKIAVEVATVYFNEAVSFVPCFKYSDSEDVVLFASRNMRYCVDNGGQFSTDYYGMKHEIIECIKSEEVYVDLNDDHVFKSSKLSELLTESKTVLYFPDFILQVSDRRQLINLLDLAAQLRNVSFFILVLFYLNRSSVGLEYMAKEGNVLKISGPWKNAILYVLGRGERNPHYDTIFRRQFFDLNQHRDLPLTDFIDVLCDNFTKYQRHVDGAYQIVPTPKQKAFLRRIITAEERFHFSEVGSGKTKVILPLLCQAFLSNNREVHRHLAHGAGGGNGKAKAKDVLIILVPEHLLNDALTQVYRYCLNLNFGEEYRVFDDIFALMHRTVQLGSIQRGAPSKQIFVTSFNQLKKALTYDSICAKVFPRREHILVVSDEVDDFLDRNKLVFNICSNKSNAFDRGTLDLFFEVSRAVYHNRPRPDMILDSSPNPPYWSHLFAKFGAIHREIQNASWSINKSFGIFNQETLRHSCNTNVVRDVEGYKSLIARPYESVNRAMPGSYYSDVERTVYLTYVILTEDVTKYDELFRSERKFIQYEYWHEHFVHQLDFDDLVYGHEKLSEIVEKHPDTKDGLTRFLYEIILRRMEIRDKSRSVNSIDIIFNLDTIGFTGTPFLDNYPTADYLRQERSDAIPDLIDRSFYAYTAEDLSVADFEERFARFQGQNSDVRVRYVSSDFIGDVEGEGDGGGGGAEHGEMATLRGIFEREERAAAAAAAASAAAGTDGADESDSGSGNGGAAFNAIVDLCGIFKRSSIHDVRDLIRERYGDDTFHYVYHIDQSNNSDRVQCIRTGNDVQYDEEFYKFLCKTYGKNLRDRIFFFVDNRNVIGKDIPFQLVYDRRFGRPLFRKSVVLAHDVDDFSKIWQAMGRSRTMNATDFSIYKSGMRTEDLMADDDEDDNDGRGDGNAHEYEHGDIKKQALTRTLYVRNCDCKMAGNISSIYLTLIALFNLSQGSFYYCDEIVNTFIEKMEGTIGKKVARHEEKLARAVLGTAVTARVLRHILTDKFSKSSNGTVARERLDPADRLDVLLRHVVQQKFEQRTQSGDAYDDIILFLSGEQRGHMEISYTKQQQKQKAKQQNKNQDSDAMGIFDKKNQVTVSYTTGTFFEDTALWSKDLAKMLLNLPVSVPILTVAYNIQGRSGTINVYPTVQFLYSHHITGAYLTEEVQRIIRSFVPPGSAREYYAHFFSAVESNASAGDCAAAAAECAPEQLFRVKTNFIRQNPQYTLAALKRGQYIIGMKDQFNVHDLREHSLDGRIQYVTDEMGFVLFDKTGSKNVDMFGPYFVEQYILMEVLSKQEVAQNVLDYYRKHKETLQRGLDSYDEKQGQGFICWRFLINETAKAAAAANAGGDDGSGKRKHRA